MAKKFDTLGVMIDVSRNAVMNLDALKNYMTILSKMGYNTVFLYAEDTYEVDDEPYFGYMRGRYTKDEMKEMDAFASSLGIEVIPCIQTLAHLEGFKRWGTVPYDIDNILMCGEDRVYELIRNMFKTLKECFKTKRLHIGMDEAWLIGRGKYHNKNGCHTPNEIIKEHLERVLEIAKEFDYDLLIWSDMFIRPWNDGGYYVMEDGIKVPKEYIEAVPETVDLVYWDYYSTDYDNYNRMIKIHKQFAGDTWFAGGVWRWSGFLPSNQFTFDTMAPALKACRDNKIKNIFMTMWGDDGSECSFFSCLPGLLYVAEYAKGNYDMDKIKAKFKRLVGIEFDDFMKIEAPNNVPPQCDWHENITNPTKYMLYSDVFNGWLDCTVAEGMGDYYKNVTEELKAIAKKSRKYAYIFDAAAKLSHVMELKYELGTKTRELYKNGDKEALLALAKNEYVEVEKRIKAFHLAFEKQWFTENKPCGFDIQDARLGGLMARLTSCRRRLVDYATGRIDSIPELEEDILPFRPKGSVLGSNSYIGSFSCNIVAHGYFTV